MFNCFQPALFNKLIFAAGAPILLAGAIFGAAFVIPAIILAQEPASPPQISPQATFPWSIHLYASPASPPNGRGLFAFTGQTPDICQDGEVTFNAEFLGVSTPFPGMYGPDEDTYCGSLDDFFDPGPGIQVGKLHVECDLPNGDQLVSGEITFWRYPYPDEMEILSDDNRAELTLNSNSLTLPHFIIVMTTNGLPGGLPVGVRAVGLPYSFCASGTTFESDGNMLLNIRYRNLLAGQDPLTLRILEWDAANNKWLDSGDQGLSVSVDPRLNKSTTKFTTYILGATPRWCDSFTTNFGLDTTENIRRNPDPFLSQLELDKPTIMTGAATSTPYTPTMEIQAWQTVSYTANIPAGTSLTVTVLSQAGQVLLENVMPGQSLAGIDPALYPSLKLRVDMSTTSPGTSPELFDWCILAGPDIQTVYLPLILKA